jgi:hypothetical protein
VNINSASETFDVDIKKDLGILDEYWVNVDIEVEFTETLTKKGSKTTASIVIVKFAYDTVFTGEPSFVPNTLYSFKISLRKFDGTSVRFCIQNVCNRCNDFFASGSSRNTNHAHY